MATWIRVLKNVSGPTFNGWPGKVYEVADPLAVQLIAGGAARACSSTDQGDQPFLDAARKVPNPNSDQWQKMAGEANAQYPTT